jgi:hypothetical protein
VHYPRWQLIYRIWNSGYSDIYHNSNIYLLYEYANKFTEYGSSAEQHRLTAVPGNKFDAAQAPAPTQIYSVANLNL